MIRLADYHQKNCWVLAGSVEDTARQECITRFPSCSIETFGREDLSLEENFSQATGLFKAKLDSLLANQE